MLVKLPPGVNFTNILLAAFVPVGLRQTYWHTAQSVQCRSWEHFLVVGIDKVDRNLIGETEHRRIMTAGTKKGLLAHLHFTPEGW